MSPKEGAPPSTPSFLFINMRTAAHGPLQPQGCKRGRRLLFVAFKLGRALPRRRSLPGKETGRPVPPSPASGQSFQVSLPGLKGACSGSGTQAQGAPLIVFDCRKQSQSQSRRRLAAKGWQMSPSHPIPSHPSTWGKKKTQALASALAVWYGAVRRCVFGKAKVKTKPGISQEGNGVVYVASRQILALSAQRRRHPSTELVAKPKPCLCPFSTVPLMAWQNVPEGPVSHFTLCSLWFCTECQRARCHL